MSTYRRKYYLHRQVKAAGFELQLENTHKTILVKSDQITTAQSNKYISELNSKFNYGVQILNPLIK